MNEKSLNRFRARLLDLAANMKDGVEAIEEATRHSTGGPGAGEITNNPMHIGDMGTDEFMFQLNATILTNEESISAQIADALQRLDDGSYGTCVECGVAISIERLDALPYAAMCIRCAEANQDAPSVNLNDGRPRSPKDTLAPEGDMNERRFLQKDQFQENIRLFEEDDRLGAEHLSDQHAVGTAGGGDIVGGLAGSNLGHGDPQISDLEDAMGNGSFDPEEDLHPKRYRRQVD